MKQQIKFDSESFKFYFETVQMQGQRIDFGVVGNLAQPERSTDTDVPEHPRDEKIVHWYEP
jgi:hypothetical protein